MAEVPQKSETDECETSIENRIKLFNCSNENQNMLRKVEELAKSFEDCEKKIEILDKRNEDVLIQNSAILQEVFKKTEYSKKLETILCYVIDKMLPINSLNIFSNGRFFLIQMKENTTI